MYIHRYTSCILLFGILVLLPLCAAEASRRPLCIELCNRAFGHLPKVDICGSDGNDYQAPLVAILGMGPPGFTCYAECGVDVFYPGTCACPNSCNAKSEKGECHNGACKCKKGWGGKDCSSVVCPDNKCSSNGECVNITAHAHACDCKKGYTGDDCSIKVANISSLPFGEIIPGSEYYKKDKYGDDHPILDIKRIANIHLTIDSNDFMDMFKPVNMFNQTRSPGSMIFSNGKVQEKHHKIGIKLKGHLARLGAKKSFVIKFEDEKFHGLKHIILKAPSLDPTYIHGQIATEFYRAMNVPVARSSFATLTVNEVYYGLYWMYEELDEQFVTSRYGNDDGNLYQMSTFLRDLGSDPEAYKNETAANLRRQVEAYKLDFGNDTYEDIAALGQLTSKDEHELKDGLALTFNVENFVRALVVLSVIDNADSSPVNGNNWALYNLPGCKNHTQWQYIPKDHEMTFINPLGDAFESVHRNPLALAHHVLGISDYHTLFNYYYVHFIKKVLDPTLKHSARDRVDVFQPFLRNLIEGDYSYHLTYGIPMGEFKWSILVEETKVFLDIRYATLAKQFDL